MNVSIRRFVPLSRSAPSLETVGLVALLCVRASAWCSTRWSSSVSVRVIHYIIKRLSRGWLTFSLPFEERSRSEKDGSAHASSR